MTNCSSRYHGGSAAVSNIRKAIDAARCEVASINDSLCHKVSLTQATRVRDCFEAFISRPASYLRIVFILDISISKGRYADAHDLPQRLCLQGSHFSTT